jgi:hypothetical protein
MSLSAENFLLKGLSINLVVLLFLQFLNVIYVMNYRFSEMKVSDSLCYDSEGERVVTLKTWKIQSFLSIRK